MSRVRVETSIAGAFLREQQGGGSAQRLVHRSFSQEHYAEYSPLSCGGDTPPADGRRQAVALAPDSRRAQTVRAADLYGLPIRRGKGR